MADSPPPPFEACKLWKKTSANGRTYLVGRLGGVRVLVMARRGEPTPGDDSTHALLFCAAPARRAQPAATQAAGQDGGPPPSRPAAKGNGRTRIEDDALPF